MSFEEDLGRQLHARAGSVKVTPDLADLGGRIRLRERKTARHERLVMSGAMVLLAGSVGGLVGVVVHSPSAHAPNAYSSRFTNPGGTSGKTPPKSASKGPRPHLAELGPRTVYSAELPNGMSATATLQPLNGSVAISGEFSATPQCATANVLTTTVGQSGSFGGGTSITSLPALSPDGLEILASGVLQVSGGGQVWWVATYVGSAVSRVAAENVGGSVFAATPRDRIAVISGSVSGDSASSGEMSAVAELGDGQSAESLGFLLGSGPKVVGEASSTANASGCKVLKLPAEPSSASSSQPADQSLAAAAVISAFEQAYSPNPLLGFAANLSAVNEGGQLTASVAGASTTSAPEAAAAPGTTLAGAAVEVQQVTFTSATIADVVYRIDGGVLLTGEAQLGPAGIWRVGLATFCGDIRAGVVGGVPAAVSSACASHG
jgi:hypothetical protein